MRLLDAAQVAHERVARVMDVRRAPFARGCAAVGRRSPDVPRGTSRPCACAAPELLRNHDCDGAAEARLPGAQASPSCRCSTWNRSRATLLGAAGPRPGSGRAESAGEPPSRVDAGAWDERPVRPPILAVRRPTAPRRAPALGDAAQHALSRAPPRSPAGRPRTRHRTTTTATAGRQRTERPPARAPDTWRLDVASARQCDRGWRETTPESDRVKLGVGRPWPVPPAPGPDNRPGHGARQSRIGITT